MTHSPTKKRINGFIFYILILIGLLIFNELCAMGGLFALKHMKQIYYTPLSEVALSQEQNEVVKKLLNGQTGHAIYDRSLGWTLKASHQTDDYTINVQSMRSKEEIPKNTSAGKVRIATFGDSFTFGQGVKDHETWQYYVEQENDNLEMLNYGVGGYGHDQAYLRYITEGEKFNPDIVIIGFISENIFRNENVFRPFYSPRTEFPLTKPRYILSGEKLKLIENPMSDLEDYRALLDSPELTIPRLGKNDYFYQQHYRQGRFDVLASVRFLKVIKYNFTNRFKPQSLFLKGDVFDLNAAGCQLSAKIIDQFYQRVLSNGSTPVIVILPTQRDLSRQKLNLEKRYGSFLEMWKEKKYNVLDLNELIFNEGVDVDKADWYTDDGHNSGQLHEKMALHLNQYLKKITQ